MDKVIQAQGHHAFLMPPLPTLTADDITLHVPPVRRISLTFRWRDFMPINIMNRKSAARKSLSFRQLFTQERVSDILYAFLLPSRFSQYTGDIFEVSQFICIILAEYSVLPASVDSLFYYILCDAKRAKDTTRDAALSTSRLCIFRFYAVANKYLLQISSRGWCRWLPLSALILIFSRNIIQHSTIKWPMLSRDISCRCQAKELTCWGSSSAIYRELV